MNNEYTLSENELSEIKNINTSINVCQEALSDSNAPFIMLRTVSEKLIEEKTKRAKWFDSVANTHKIVFSPENFWEVDFSKGTIAIK